MYKIISTALVKRLADGACIPADAANRDWRTYQEWLAAGNTPEPADPESPAPSIAETIDSAIDAHPALHGLVRVLASRFSLTEDDVRAAIKARMGA